MALTNKQKKEMAKLEAILEADRTDEQNERYAELLEIHADGLDNDNVGDDEVEGASGDDVYVFANLQNGQSFKIGGKTVTINVMPVARLQKPGGGFFPGGKYGVTAVPAADWKEVMQVYGNMRMFKTGIVFAADSLEEGKAMARERGGLRHGFEQIDPNSNRVKSTPKTEE